MFSSDCFGAPLAGADVTGCIDVRGLAGEELGSASRKPVPGTESPVSTTWTDDPDPSVRLRTALADVDRFYPEGAPMLRRVTADHDAPPEWLRRQRAEESTRLREALLAAAGAPRPGALASAVAAHALEFMTWESLVVRNGVRPDRAVELMAGLLERALA